MKKTLVKSLAMAFVGSLLVAGSAMAMPYIDGSIGMGGAFTPVDAVNTPTSIVASTGIDFANASPNMVVTTATGDFSVLTPFLATGTMTDFQFNPLSPSPVVPLWTITYGGSTFSLDLTSVAIVSQIPNYLELKGAGVVHGTGYADTVGEWKFSANSTNGSFGWAATTGADGAPVPEPATMLLLGTGLAGLAGARRRKATK